MDTASKENVQNTIKNLEDKILFIEKLLEKGSDCLIFQYGSSSIKFNRANEVNPQKIHNLIAHKRYEQEKYVPKQENYDDFDLKLIELEQIQLSHNKPDNAKVYKGKPRGKVEVDLRWQSSFVRHTEVKETITLCPFAKDIEQKKVVFEDEVFLYENNPDYIVRQPIKYGFFNGASSIDDLYLLTMYAVTVKLGIPQNQIEDYSFILIIPDIFNRMQIKNLVDMILRLCGFKQIYIHLESVLACFGLNQQSACIVDIGSDKINICCVDEGVILPGSYIRKNFGSRDIDITLERLIQKKHAMIHTKKGFKLDQSYGDLLQISKLKERAVQFNSKDDKSNYVYDMHTIRDGKEERFQVAHTDALNLAPFILFESSVVNALNKPCPEEFDYTSRLFEMFYDPEDNLEELSGGVQLSWCWGSKEREQLFTAQQEDIYQQLHPSIMQPLDWMVCQSVAGVLDAELRPKLASNIILIGGGAHLIDLQEELEARIQKRSIDLELEEKFEVRSFMREDLRPQNVAWVGASVLPKTESVNEMWITRQRWVGELEFIRDEMEEVLEQFDGDVGALEKKVMLIAKKEKEKEKSGEWGLKHLKEKIPFVW